MPVALGEQEYRLFEDWRLMLGMHADEPAADIAQPDLGYVGGPSRAMQATTHTCVRAHTHTQMRTGKFRLF